MNCSHCVRSSSNCIAAGIQSCLSGSKHWATHFTFPITASAYDKNTHICPRTSYNCCSLLRQPSSCKPWSEHIRLQHHSLFWTSPDSFSEEVRMSGSSLWWWRLWLSSLNFNPQHSVVGLLSWIQLYVLLMIAKFHTWKAGFVAMKDPVSARSLSLFPSLYYLSLFSALWLDLHLYSLVCSFLIQLKTSFVKKMCVTVSMTLRVFLHTVPALVCWWRRQKLLSWFVLNNTDFSSGKMSRKKK